MKSYQTIKEKRATEFEKNPHIKSVATSRICHAILLPLLKFSNRINHLNVSILNDKRELTNKPVIYACTHIGFYDICVLFEALKSPCWLFLGNPDPILGTFYGWLVERNGVVYVDTYDKGDRKIAKKMSAQLLRQGGRLMIFPEGAWNLTENLPCMKLFRGASDLAVETDAEIIPVAIDQYGKDFYVNIGENIRTAKDDCDVQLFTEQLRDILATLKWEIWESFPITERKSISEELKHTFAQNILVEAGDSYTMKMCEDERYHDKNITSTEEAFAFVKNLIPRRENAFLFRGLENAVMEGTMEDRKTD
jgi:1-acyl-sn-glycerol-3-phosphate acyltransferase